MLGSHLLFADDLILFTKGIRSFLSHLFIFLALYEETLGQCINKSKSSFYVSKHCSQVQLRRIESVTGTLPFWYLSYWLYKGRKRAHYIQHLIDAVNKRVAGWMGNSYPLGA